MADWQLRLRALLDARFALVVGVLVVLALVGGWVTYTTHVAPATVTEERQASSWQTTGRFTHAATVTEPNPIYPVGTTLTNRSVYLTRLSPWLNGTYAFAYDASDRGDLNETVTLTLVLAGVETRDGTETVIWKTTRRLERTTRVSVKPGETVRVPFAVDMNATANRTNRIEDSLDDPPGTPVARVVATVHLNGTVNGRPVDRVEEATLPVHFGEKTYRPGAVDPSTERHDATQTVTVERTYGPLRRFGAPALLAGALLALAALLAGRLGGVIALSATERERLVYEDDRDDFDEWITTIRLPDAAFDLPHARASSLGALVDFAIDTDNGVVEDPHEEAYYVVHDGYLYCYRPPTR